MARARDIANLINSNTFLTPASASATYATKVENGLVLLDNRSFTSVSEIIYESVFTDEYDNYTLDLNITTSSFDGAQIRMQMRSGSSNNTNANYIYSGFYNPYATGTYNGIAGGSSLLTYFYVVYSRTATGGGGRIEINNPKKNYYTNFRSYGFNLTSNTTGDFNFFAGNMTLNAQYDGFVIFPNSGSITGDASLYGRRV